MVEAPNTKLTKTKTDKYPHRVVIRNHDINQIVSRMRYLIKRKIDTLENIEATPVKYLIHKYFVDATIEDVHTAFIQYRVDKGIIDKIYELAPTK